jgi:hypothetical protein
MSSEHEEKSNSKDYGATQLALAGKVTNNSARSNEETDPCNKHHLGLHKGSEMSRWSPKVKRMLLLRLTLPRRMSILLKKRLIPIIVTTIEPATAIIPHFLFPCIVGPHLVVFRCCENQLTSAHLCESGAKGKPSNALVPSRSLLAPCLARRRACVVFSPLPLSSIILIIARLLVTIIPIIIRIIGVPIAIIVSPSSLPSSARQDNYLASIVIT